MDLDKMESLYWRKIKIPKGLPQLLNIFLRETIRHNPPQADIHIFLYELATELANKRNAEHPEEFDPESAAKDKGQQDERDVKTPLGTIKEESLESSHPAAAPPITTTINLSDSEAVEVEQQKEQKESDREISVEKVRDESFTESSEESHLLENEPKVKNRGKIKKRITFSIDEDSEPAREISAEKVEEIVEESFPPAITTTTETTTTDTDTITIEPELLDEDFEAELQALQAADFESEELITTANKLIDEVEEEVQVFISATNNTNTDNRTSTSSDIDNFRPSSHSPSMSMSRDSRASEPSEDTTEITESFDSVVRVTLKNNEDSTSLDKNQEDHQIEGQAYAETENKSVEVEPVPVPVVDDGIQLLDLDQKQMVVEESQVELKDVINQQPAEVEMISDEKLEKIDTEQVDSNVEIETQNTPTKPEVVESEESLKISQTEDEIEPTLEKPELPSTSEFTQMNVNVNEIIIPDVPTIVKRRSKSANITDVGRRTGINFEDYDENIIAEALKDCSQEKLRSASAGSKPSIKPRTKITQQESSQSQVIDKFEEQEDNIMMVDIEKELIQEAGVEGEAKGDSSEDKRLLLARVKDGSRSPTSLEEISQFIDDEEAYASAVKIQSAFRGFQTRKCLESGGYNNGKLQSSSTPQTEEQCQLELEQGGQTISLKEESEIQVDITPEKILKFIEKDKSTEDTEGAKSTDSTDIEGKDLNPVTEKELDQNQAIVPVPAVVEELEGKVKSVEIIDENLSFPESSECDSSMLNESATKIQAHFRGYQTRKELKGLVSPPTPATPDLSPSPVPEPEPEPETSTSIPIPPIPPRTPEEEALEEFIEKEVMDSAATRIQAQYRGFKVRKDFENKKLSTIQPSADTGIGPGEEKIIEEKEKVDDQIEDKSEKVVGESKEIIQGQGQTNTTTTITTASTLTAEEEEEVEALKQMIAEENEEGIQALNKAAVSLQSKFKGFKARKGISKKPTPTPAQTPAPAEVKMIEEKKIELKVEPEPEPEQMLPVEQVPIDYNNDENVELPLPLDEEDNSSNSDNSQIMNKSATKIQAQFRGYQTRKRIGSGNNKKSQSINTNVTTDDNNRSNLNNEYYASAVKIQSGVRGFLVRQRVKKNPDILPRNKQFYEKKKAVVKIQATVRGFLTRRRLQKSRQRRKSSSASLVSNRSKE